MYLFMHVFLSACNVSIFQQSIMLTGHQGKLNLH